jgi:hypothetical protein
MDQLSDARLTSKPWRLAESIGASATIDDRKPDLSGFWRILGSLNYDLNSPLISKRPTAKFIHTPEVLVILHADLTYRRIFLDGRPILSTATAHAAV